MTVSTAPAESARRFLTRCLLDRDHGGVLGATDSTGARPRSRVKRLADQADAVLVLADPAVPVLPAELELALAGLRSLLDHGGRPGFREAATRSWAPVPGDGVRTLRHQLKGATALLAAGHRLDDDRTRAEAVDVLNRCLATFGWAGPPVTLGAGSPEAVTGVEPALLTDTAGVTALAVAEAVGESEVDCSPLPALAERMTGRALHLQARPARFLPCPALAELAVALVQVGRLLGSAAPAMAAGRLLAIVAQRYADPDDGGFWRWPARPGPAGSSGAGSTRLKWASDAARLWAAADLVRSVGEPDAGVADLARPVVHRLTDPAHGGVFAALRSGPAIPVLDVKSAPVQSAVARLPLQAAPGRVLGTRGAHRAGRR